MKTTILLSAVLILISMTAHAQDRVVLMNGKTLNGKVSDFSGKKIVFEFPGRNDIKRKTIDREDVFSIRYNNSDFQYYKCNPAEGNYLTSTQMKHYLKGRHEASLNYHAPLATIGGLVTGVSGAFIGFYGIAIPTAYVFTTGMKTPKKPITISAPEIPDFIVSNTMTSEAHSAEESIEVLEEQAFQYYFNEGYIAKAKDKKIKNALKGTVIGFIGFAIGSFFILR